MGVVKRLQLVLGRGGQRCCKIGLGQPQNRETAGFIGPDIQPFGHVLRCGDPARDQFLHHLKRDVAANAGFELRFGQLRPFKLETIGLAVETARHALKRRHLQDLRGDNRIPDRKADPARFIGKRSAADQALHHILAQAHGQKFLCRNLDPELLRIGADLALNPVVIVLRADFDIPHCGDSGDATAKACHPKAAKPKDQKRHQQPDGHLGWLAAGAWLFVIGAFGHGVPCGFLWQR